MSNSSSKLISEVIRELDKATIKYGPFKSVHEGYSIILEELDELWDEIKKKTDKRDPSLMREEAIQVAAMGIRFVMDCCGEKNES